jgi:phage anti-repressor protein
MKYQELFAAVLVEMEKEKMKKALLGRLTGISGEAISSWARGKSTPSHPRQVAAMFKMIDMFNIDVERFAIKETVGGRLEFLRIKNKLQIVELASLVPCHRSSICNLELGNKIPSRLLNNFAEVLKTTPEFISYGEPKMMSVIPTPEIRGGLIEIPPTQPPFSIELYIKQIGGDDVNAVNARELWIKLEVGRDFSNWIKDRIEKWNFKEGTDYTVAKIGDGESSGFQPIDYFISLDMAKELSMVENNEQGRQARRYFIECEKVAKSAGATKAIDPTSPDVRYTMWQAREFARLSGASKREADEYVNRITEEKHGIRPIKVVTGERHQQLKLHIVK